MEVPSEKQHLKKDLEYWKSKKNAEWFSASKIVNPYEHALVPSYRRATRFNLIQKAQKDAHNQI